MEPYYSDEHVTIYCGDCREILPELPRVDLVLTDPPYGIGLDTQYSQRRSRDIKGRDYARVIGDDCVSSSLVSAAFSIGQMQIVFGANNFPQFVPFNPKRDGWICWDKRTNEDADAILGSPFEMAVVRGRRMYRMVRMQHCGVKHADGDRAGRFHPTQKPVRLFKVILAWLPAAQTILDPFMGSGTTLRAAKDLGRKAIGIEIEEKYCEIAANRMRQKVLAFTT